MNLSKLLSLLVLAASVANNLQAATHFVVAESSFQAAINAAAPGDTLMVEPGIYTDATVLFNKPLTVIASGGALGGTFNFTGSVRVEAPGALTYFQQAYFIGPVQMVGSPVLAVDSTFNNATGASGGKLTAKRTSFNTTLSITNTPFEGLRATIYQFFALGNIPEKPSLVMAQSSLSANVAQQITGYKVWLGYNASLWNLTLTSCESTLIGNTIRGNGFIVSSGTIKAYNNLLVFGQAVTAMSLNDGVLNAELVNNTLYAASHSYSVGLAARGSLGPINLVGNIFSAWPKTNKLL